MFSGVNLFYPKLAMKNGVPIAAQNLAVAAAAVTPVGFLTDVSGVNPVQFVEFSVDGGAVRARADGTAPTATVGELLAQGSVQIWAVSRFNVTQFIAASGAASIFATPLAS